MISFGSSTPVHGLRRDDFVSLRLSRYSDPHPTERLSHTPLTRSGGIGTSSSRGAKRSRSSCGVSGLRNLTIGSRRNFGLLPTIGFRCALSTSGETRTPTNGSERTATSTGSSMRRDSCDVGT